MSSRRVRKALYAVVAPAVLIAAFSGCAASRALNAPVAKNYGVLEPGTHGDLVRAELGEPVQSIGGDRCDLFTFQEGSSGSRYLRAIGYSILVIPTVGLSEIVTNPLEASIGQEKVRLRICYDTDHKVVSAERLEVGRPPELLTGVSPLDTPTHVIQ